ncbi:MAG: nucleotidyltransferase family protein [Salegentibacter sp.]|uniref:Molybdenum cofactor cytidylyltransferase n=1 Tax=Salegentibacter flavus TaxID=287099 RepID=A0A1I5CB57_9FLAO|nr:MULTISPECIES: nucleotidyltransferase family protein [Salegentibacter]MDR9458110.1 nucleotidyltransferase family protein [Salegentibacter sp.]SFN84203.1 molybdenum cofactor cytidylyltransferase [Salegentibacter flavus]
MKDNAKIGVIILAAGSSSRLGYPKQLVEFKGISLLQHCIDVVESLKLDPKILVLGAKEDEINKKIDPRNFEVVINENWEEGMSTSIRKGISEALKIEKELEQILILLSDQPLVTKDKIEELIEVQLKSKQQGTFSEYAGEPGVPAIFSREIFSDLKKLKGDQGAKKLIYNKDFQFGTVKFENGNFDVDTTADVELLKQMEKE